MKKYLLIAILLVAVMAMPAFASVQNVKVSGDIKATSLIRNDFDLGLKDTSTLHQNVFFTQTRVRVDADLTDNVSTTVRLLNEKPWNADSTTNTDIELDLAYVQLREMLYSPLTVTIGRQVLSYGNGFILGDGPNNRTRNNSGLASVAQDLSMVSGRDAIKLSLNYDPLTVDMFMAKIDQNTVGMGYDDNGSTDLYGIYGTYKLSDKWNTTAEAYFISRTADKTTPTTTAAAKADTIYIPGFRVATNPIKGLNISAELAWQTGNEANMGTVPYVNAKREAMGGQFIASYLLPFEKLAKYEPIATFAYTYASGDSDPNPTRTLAQNSSEKDNGWNPMYEKISSGKVYNALLDLTNCHVYEYSFQAKPIKDLTAKATWTMLWLDKKNRAGAMYIYRPDIAGAITGGTLVGTDTTNKHIGNEVDLDLTYAYTEDVSIGVSAGWFMPGDLFTAANEDTASQVITSVAVAF